MLLRELFHPEDFLLDFQPADKWDAIQKLLERLVESGRIPAALAPELHKQVLERERSMSTGMERGIAIPHAAVDGLPGVVAAMGLVQRQQGLSFDSIDARPARIVVLLLIPRAQKLVHIRTLAEIARVLGRDELRGELLAAKSGRAAWESLAAAETTRGSPA